MLVPTEPLVTASMILAANTAWSTHPPAKLPVLQRSWITFGSILRCLLPWAQWTNPKTTFLPVSYLPAFSPGLSAVLVFQRISQISAIVSGSAACGVQRAFTISMPPTFRAANEPSPRRYRVQCTTMPQPSMASATSPASAMTFKTRQSLIGLPSGPTATKRGFSETTPIF